VFHDRPERAYVSDSPVAGTSFTETFISPVSSHFRDSSDSYCCDRNAVQFINSKELLLGPSTCLQLPCNSFPSLSTRVDGEGAWTAPTRDSALRKFPTVQYRYPSSRRILALRPANWSLSKLYGDQSKLGSLVTVRWIGLLTRVSPRLAAGRHSSPMQTTTKDSLNSFGLPAGEPIG
jgi:hypothetical protein